MISKSFIRIPLPITLLLLSSLACSTVMDYLKGEPGLSLPATPIPAEPRTGEPLPADPTSEADPPLGQSPATEDPVCPGVTDQILRTATEPKGGKFVDESDEQPEQLYLVTYSVSGDQISDPQYGHIAADLAGFQEDAASHREIWETFTALIPQDERSLLAEYSIVTDGEGNILAAVTQTFFDPALWALEVDIRDSDDKFNLTYTFIHEYAHLLTLGPGQVTPSVAVFNNPDDDDIYFNEASACPDYFPGEGCSQPDSYINAFFEQFWADIHADWQDINLIEEDDAYYEALDDFYFAHEDRFVTDYAATNPEEDIAEAFTFFVLSPHPDSDTIKGKKILFFYQYPELVQLRAEILTRVCKLNQ